MVRIRPLVSVAVGRDRYSVGYSPPGALTMGLAVRCLMAVAIGLRSDDGFGYVGGYGQAHEAEASADVRAAGIWEDYFGAQVGCRYSGNTALY
jgi:hypothetical protein